MNFTREPIIETIITPKEEFKLVIRNSNGKSEEEYSVNSVEIVSFGKSFFFRSLERPKAFLLPVSDFEIIETREARTALKKPKIEKSIKIGGGKASKSRAKELPLTLSEEESLPRKFMHGKSSPHRCRSIHKEEEIEQEEAVANSDDTALKQEITQPQHHTLLPPPTSLISEQINRYKDYLAVEGALISKKLEERDKITALSQESTQALSFLSQDEVATTQELSMFKKVSKEEASTSSEVEN